MKTRWQDWVNLIFGLWLFFSPWLLQYALERPYMDQTTASWNSVVCGGAVVFFAARALFAPKRKNWEEWTNLIAGLWLIVSPWALEFSAQTVATANMVIIGLVIAFLSGTALGRRFSTPAVY